MSSSVASFVLRRTLSRGLLFGAPICRPRCFSSLSTPSLVSRVLVARTLTRPCPAVSVRFASSVTVKGLTPDEKIKRADENLLRVLESEIDDVEEAGDEPHQKLSLPEDCPFEIIDNPGDQSVILKRQFQDENIEITVFMNFEEEEQEEETGDEDEDEDDGKDTDNASKPAISLVVNINKAGTDRTLEFCCNLDSEGVEIESMAVKRLGDAGDEDESYKGPDFSELDQSLQKAFRRYLIVRGIKPALYDFLSEYMMIKDDKEYAHWLKNLKEFVASGQEPAHLR